MPSSPALEAKRVELPSVKAHLSSVRARRIGPLRSLALDVLSRFVGHDAASARLSAYRLALLDTRAFDALLPRAPRGSLLDVGAGTGEVHRELAALFAASVALDVSRPVVERARRLGVDARVFDLSRAPWPDEERFDVVALLNVLDRAERPVTLLERAIERVGAEGHLLVATPLPLRPAVLRPGGSADPDEWLGVEGDDFAPALESLVEGVLAPRGLHLVRWTRTPYVSSGDPRAPSHEHDDAVLVLRRGAIRA